MQITEDKSIQFNHEGKHLVTVVVAKVGPYQQVLLYTDPDSNPFLFVDIPKDK